jgi:putative drug exporter of the RND superfamily
VVLVVEHPGLAHDRRALADLQAVLRTDPAYAGVLGAAQQPFRGPAGAVLSRSGNAARYVLISARDPLGAAALNRLAGLRGILPGTLAGLGLGDATFGLAGDTALSLETVEAARTDMRRVAPVALAAVLLMLGVLLRALVAPLYLVAASVLALAASLGLTVWVFEGLLGRPDTDYLVPFAAAVLLLALGSDYNVFLTGRIRQEAEVRPLREAVAVAGSRAARAITVAGIVLALSFSLLALVPVLTFRELAFAMCAGLLIDAFLVRTVFVPALISMFGLGRGRSRGRGVSRAR